MIFFAVLLLFVIIWLVVVVARYFRGMSWNDMGSGGPKAEWPGADEKWTGDGR